MISSKEADCLGYYFGTKSTITVQRKFRGKYKKYPSISKQYCGLALEIFSRGETLWIDKEVSRQVHPKKMLHASDRHLFPVQQPQPGMNRENYIPCTTKHRDLYKRLNFQAYKVQNLHALQSDDMPRLFTFVIKMLECMDSDGDFLRLILFTVEATFHFLSFTLILYRHKRGSLGYDANFRCS